MTDFNFRQWVEDEMSEYDPPDEGQMEKILSIPLKGEHRPDLMGDRWRFYLPTGGIEEFLIQKGAVIGLKAARGSLNARCFELGNAKNWAELYRILRYIRFNGNKKIRSQLINHNTL